MKKNSTIRTLERKAAQGSIKSAFQLYENYSKGRYVDQDIDKAEEYEDIVRDVISNSAVKLSSLRLKDFRGFSDLQIDFKSNGGVSGLVVFSGPNGVGKTTVLKAISNALSWLIARVNSPKNTGRAIEYSDIHRSPEGEALYTNLVVNMELESSDLMLSPIEKFGLTMFKSARGVDSPSLGDYEDFSTLAAIYRHFNTADSGFNLPLFAFYGVERSVEVSSKDEKLEDELGFSGQAKSDGFQKALTGYTDFRFFFRWLKFNQDIINSKPENDPSYSDHLDKIEEEIRSLRESIEAAKTANSTVLEILQNALTDRVKYTDNFNVSEEDHESINRRIKMVKVVTSAISSFLPGFDNFRIQYEPDFGMVLDKNGVTLSVLQLSQGEKSLLALVADIARRLVLLNPSLENPLEGKGVVLIDEIDLHLHPEWQQKVVTQLVSVFPNIQFFLSTHSPQVLSTVSRECIRVLDIDEGVGIASTPTSFTYGELSSDVLERVMRVNPQPPVPEKYELEKLTSLVEQGLYDSKEAESLIESLENKLNENHPQLMRVRRSIRRLRALQ